MNKTDLAIAVFDKRAKEYQDKYMDVSLYHDSFDVFCNAIKKQGAEILELACGPGNVTRYLLDKRPDFKILGIDLATNMLDLARKNNPEAEFRLMDCRDIGRLNKKYDGIAGGFCLPYLSKEESVRLIRHAAGLLKPNGILYLSTMEDDYSKSGLQTSSYGDQAYIHYHQADYLVAALEENGFRIMDLQRKEYVAPGGAKTTDLVIIANLVENSEAIINKTNNFYP